MKRILAIFLVVSLLILCVVGCNKQPATNEGTQNSSTQSSNKVEGPATVEYGAESAETPLSNTYKLLHSGDKKLTIGYIGGSITYGTSAAYHIGGEKGDIKLSYVNRVSTWFKETYPDATIETVNAGVSDTATNFGVFRLEKTLMNTDGHDIPDLVFIEYTTNDWFQIQTKEDLLVQIESLIRNVWEINPYCEIVFLSTQREFKNSSVAAYKEMGEKYNIPFIDLGAALRSAMYKKHGIASESRTNYYTIDNLHPSAAGYGVYFDAIKPVLEENFNFELKDWKLYDYKANLQDAAYENLITAPQTVSVDKLTFSGAAKLVQSPVFVDMHDTGLSLVNKELVNCHLNITGKATISYKFSGTTFGMLFDLDKDKEFYLRYQIDGGEWVEFGVNSKMFAFQKYDHTQAFINEHNLTKGEHTVKIEFQDGSETKFGGLLVNGK